MWFSSSESTSMVKEAALWGPVPNAAAEDAPPVPSPSSSTISTSESSSTMGTSKA